MESKRAFNTIKQSKTINKEEIMNGIMDQLGGIENILEILFKHENMELFSKNQWQQCMKYLQSNKVCFYLLFLKNNIIYPKGCKIS